MTMRRATTATFLLVLLIAMGGCHSSGWAGTWQQDGDPDHGGDLHCNVKQLDDQDWSARFTGYCGRYFAYKITMKGRTEGDAVLFHGESDLGEQDGGLYQWTGQIEGDRFTGKYSSSAGKTGSFAMSRR